MKRGTIELVPDASNCSGCGACVLSCPKGAIAMQPAPNGVVYPVIERAVCVECGQCVQQCTYRRQPELQKPQTAFAAVAGDAELVRKSASGGMFAALAKSWMANGGLIAGAVLDCSQGVKVYHILTDRLEDLERLQGSKYVQSDAWRCFGDVRNALNAGRQVLFSGTPCQVAAMKALTGNHEGLTTIDLICHGVPSAKMLEDYFDILNHRFHGKIDTFQFRDKTMNRRFSASFDVRYGKKRRRYYLRSHELSFYKYFLAGANYRENCYSCPYARLERVSDLTIGDYWGIDKRHGADIAAGRMPKAADWSCVLVNTDKGRRLLDAHAQQILLYPSRPEWVAEENHQLQHPTVRPEGRAELMKRYEQGGYRAVEAAFIQERGGWLKYHFRLVKALYSNYRQVQKQKSK